MKLKSKINIFRNLYFRTGIVFLLIIAICCMTVLIYIFGRQVLFTENNHFILKRIIVVSSGVWNNRKADIIKYTGLIPGRVNLFNINLIKIRESLTSKHLASIESAQVQRILPDTISIKIVERIPRALLYTSKTDLAVDSSCTLIPKDLSIDIDSDLPIITGFLLKNPSGEKAKFGDKVPQILPAVELITLVNTTFPNLNFKRINLSTPNEIVATLATRSNHEVIIKLPFKYSPITPPSTKELKKRVENLKLSLSRLKRTLYFLTIQGRRFKEINLLFTDQAVVQ